MKKLVLFLFLVFPTICSAQTLIRCNDSISFFLNQNENFYTYIKLTGDVRETGNNKVLSFNNCVIQTLLTNKKEYISHGTDDIAILTDYMISETQYFTGVYKEKLNLMMTPIQISKDKKAVIWDFDIPEKAQKQIQPGETPAIKQVSISIVLDDYVYSIGTTLFKDQSFSDLKKLIAYLILTVQYNTGQLDIGKLCNDIQ